VKNGKKKKILNDVNLLVKPGEILGIIGPSGGGKTTLLNVIAGRSHFGRTEGEVRFNGRTQSHMQIKSFTNYVMAHDKLHAYLTVDETLHIAAKLKLPELTNLERAESVENVVREMGLQRCRQTYVGGEWRKGISTGEMKRVSIAIELLDNPQLLLLDEPTSGLDSSLALEVMQVLVNLARAGRTVIITIHQPRSQVFSMIDSVVLVNRGRVVYNGPPDAVRPQFQSWGYPCPLDWNPADFIMDLISDKDSTVSTDLMQSCDLDVDAEHGKGGISLTTDRITLSTTEVDALADKWSFSDHQTEICRLADSITQNPGPSPSPEITKMDQTKKWKYWPSEFAALYKRFSLNSLRNPVVCCLMLLIHSIQGCILGGIFFQLSGGVQASSGPTNTSPDWLNSTWAKVYMYGVDGNGYRPFVEMVEDGVDGMGSRPLVQLLGNSTMLAYIHDLMSCAYDAYGLDDIAPTYPPHEFTAPDTWPTIPSRMLNEFTEMRSSIEDLIYDINTGAADLPTDVLNVDHQRYEFDGAFSDLRHRILQVTPSRIGLVERGLQTADSTTAAFPDAPTVVSDLTVLLQLFDYFIFRADYERAERCLDQKENALMFYLCVMTNADYLLNPLLQCLDFPPLPGNRAVSTPTSPVRRQLAESSTSSLLGPEMEGFINATQVILQRLTSCNNQICDAIASSLDYTTNVVSASVNTIYIVLNLAGCLFFAVANLGFASYDALLTFPQERAIFNHETANGLYGVSSYFLAKNFADLPFQLTPALTLSTVYYWLVGLAPSTEQFFVYFGICACVSFAAYGFGYMVSAGSPRMEISVLIAPFTLVIWLVLAGFFLRDPDIPSWIGWFKYFSIYRWGFFALLTNQFRPGTFYGTLPAEVILSICGITDTRLWFTCLMCIVLGFAFRIVCFFFLTFTNRKVGVER